MDLDPRICLVLVTSRINTQIELTGWCGHGPLFSGCFGKRIGHITAVAREGSRRVCSLSILQDFPSLPDAARATAVKNHPFSPAVDSGTVPLSLQLSFGYGFMEFKCNSCSPFNSRSPRVFLAANVLCPSHCCVKSWGVGPEPFSLKKKPPGEWAWAFKSLPPILCHGVMSEMMTPSSQRTVLLSTSGGVSLAGLCLWNISRADERVAGLPLVWWRQWHLPLILTGGHRVAPVPCSTVPGGRLRFLQGVGFWCSVVPS